MGRGNFRAQNTRQNASEAFFFLTCRRRRDRLKVGGGSAVHTEYTVSRTPEQVTAMLAEQAQTQQDHSPLRRALWAHFQAYQGLTQPALRSDLSIDQVPTESAIYKDTASGNIV